MTKHSERTRLDGLDKHIKPLVLALREHGVETFESCEGGNGHAFHEATIRFFGDRYEGLRVLSIALRIGLPVADLRRYWQLENGEPVGPQWEMTFLDKEIGERIDKSYGK